MERTLGFNKLSRRGRIKPKLEIFYMNQSLPAILREVSVIVCKQEIQDANKSLCLSYLNDAVRIISKKRDIIDDNSKVESNVENINNQTCQEDWNCKETKLKYFYLIQCCLLHKEKEIRATGLRLLRYIIDCPLDVECLIEVNAVPLITRCIDICTANHIERVPGLRLARCVLQVAPSLFPQSLGRCLVAIARNGNEEKDRILKSAQAVLLEIAILNPSVFVDCGGVSCLLRGILDCPLPRINEALLSTLLYLMNNPQWRKYCSQFHNILSPLSDFFAPGDEMNRITRDRQAEASSLAVLAALRSWAGLIMFYQKKDKALKSIVELLVLPNEVTQRCIILLLFDLFRIAAGNWHTDFDSALKERASMSSVDADACRLREGFVVAEAKVTLPHIAKFRPNLVKNYFSLVLYTFMKMGLFPALCTVIVSASDALSIKTTMLLGELLYEANQNMPAECSSLSHILPLLSMKATETNGEIKIRATEAISALLKLSRILASRKEAPVVSLYLREILARREARTKEVVDDYNREKLSRWFHKDRDDLVYQSIKDSKVLVEGLPWDKWEIHHLIPVFTWPSESLIALEDLNYKQLIRKLLHHYKPSSKLFGTVELSNTQARLQADLLLLYIKFLITANQTTEGKFLTELLEDINSSLEGVACERPSHDLDFSPTKLNTTASQYYFLAIGHIMRSKIGYELVNKAGIFTQLINIVDIPSHDANACMYEKLIASSLDYSGDGLNREILRKIMKNKRESSRMYATQLLKVFIRAKVADFDKWGIELLVEQLYDDSKAVALCALEVLDEALDDKEHLEAVLQVTPSVPHLGDQWQLLRAKIISSPRGYASYNEGKLISNLLNKWANSFNIKYVKLMQTALAESLTRLQRGEDGLYGRRTGNKHLVHDVYLLPHLYGSLTLHKDGFATLIQHEHIKVLLEIVRDGCANTPQEILQLKAAIWALGHLARSRSGVAFLNAENMFGALEELAAGSQVYSVRGTVFYAFCLIATTAEGVSALKKIGWGSVCRHHHETHQTQNMCSYKTSQFYNDEAEGDEEDASRSGFYIDEFDEDSENFCLVDDFDDMQCSPKKSQTLPHDTKPPSYYNHQRSLSDCAAVIEEIPTAESNEQTNFVRKGSRLKNKILSSFRNRPGKRRDSVGSKTSNSSSTSERLVSFLQSTARRRRRNTRTSTECDEFDSSTSYSMTDPTYSDDDAVSKIMDSPPVIRPSLSPIASGASLSTCDSQADTVFRLRTSGSLGFDINSTRRKKHSFSGFGCAPHQRTSYRRGMSECGHDDSSAKNSLIDFLVSSYEKSPCLSRSIVDRSLLQSSSICSEVSSVRSLSTISVRGSGANLPSRSYGLPSIKPASDCHPSGQCYLGLSLPLDLDKLLLDDSIEYVNVSDIIPEFMDGFPTNKEEFRKEAEKNFCLRHHTSETCLSCFSLRSNSPTDDCEPDEIPLDEKSLKTRKQILKCVSQLCVSHCASYEEAKKGLLYIKYVAATGFQDGCTYTEVFHLLSTYSFGLNARRLIQELFEDFRFPTVLTKARRIISQFDEDVFESVEKITAQHLQSVKRKELNSFDEFPDFNYELNDGSDDDFN